MIPNKRKEEEKEKRVVNCFQNCTFTYDSQRKKKGEKEKEVVNCFQNCTFTYDSQQEREERERRKSCELLSKLYFYL